MRANNLPFPISTYTFGEHPAPASAKLRPGIMRRSYSLTVAGMFAGASAVATFGPIRLEAPVSLSMTLPSNFYRADEPNDAVRPPVGAQFSAKLDSVQPVVFAFAQVKRHQELDPRGGLARRQLSHPRLAQLRPSLRPAPTGGPILSKDPSTDADRLAPVDNVGGSSLPLGSFERVSSSPRSGAGKGDADSADVGMASADPADSFEGPRLAVSASAKPALSPVEHLIVPSAQQPLADAGEDGLLLVDAHEPTFIGSAVEPSAVHTGARSAGRRLEAGGAVSEQAGGSPQVVGARRATFSSTGAVELGSVTAELPSADPAKIAVQLDRIRKRYVDIGAPEPPIDPNGSAAGDATHTKGAHSGVYVAFSTENMAKVVIHDDELVAVQLGELISLFETRLDRPLFVWMRSSSAASKFVTTETLAAAGIKATYDSRSKRLVLTADKD